LNKALYCGWDVGGAHLKAALLNECGDVQQVIQLPCALWRGMHVLEAAIKQILQDFNVSAEVTHAVTMTGELVDLFENRQQGVLEISRVMHEQLGENIQIFSADFKRGYDFLAMKQVNQHWSQIASANWLASASLVAQNMPDGLLIDMGSTTTDFVVLHAGKPSCLGFSDAERLTTKELVYTGVVRTPLMALTKEVVFQGKPTGITAEYFATTADIYRLLGELPSDEDMAETADGKDKTSIATARRIARMIGRDVEDAMLNDWQNLARNFKDIQLDMLHDAALQHVARLVELAPSLPKISMIGAGAGQFLLKALVESLNQHKTTMTKNLVFEYIPCDDVALPNLSTKQHQKDAVADWASICLPAVAVAKLAFNRVQ
jgi:probable H4MPT-linked C1 transfer pathway protein